MSNRRGFGFAGGGGGGGQSGVKRTHLLFSSQTEQQSTKRKRRTTNNRFVSSQHRKDETVQTTSPTEIDPETWTGNQRVLHFGPMAQRDPFFYYYPKGWDILYPAHFGFFPYRTTKFRGSSPTICLSAFGGFLLFGGALMTLLSIYLLNDGNNWWSMKSPIQIAGPCLMLFGIILVLFGVCAWICTLNLCRDSLRHTRLHHEAPRLTIVTRHHKEPIACFNTASYHPLPPPSYPVLANAHTEASLFNVQAELKVYPPVMPGYSTLSLHGRSPSVYMGSPYNTLRALSHARHHSGSVDRQSVVENVSATGESSSRRASVQQQQQSNATNDSSRRSKSTGAVSTATRNLRRTSRIKE